MNDMTMPAERLPDLMTAEELLRLDIPDKSTELVRGRLIVKEPPGTYHGIIQSNLHRLVASFVHANGLGVVCGQDTGFKIASNPDTVRAPDLAFLTRERSAPISRRGYAAVVPDLVAEILSPDDRPGEVLAKVADWLDAGVRLVWVIDADRRQALAHRSDGSVVSIDASGSLLGEDVLPGFQCTLSEVLSTALDSP